MTCPYCDIHKLSAAMWRNKAYELGGTPLPWDADKKIAEAIAAEREATLGTIDELIGMERDRHPMFSEGYDYALLHIKEFVTARRSRHDHHPLLVPTASGVCATYGANSVGVQTGGVDMNYLPSDIARCAGAHKPECEDCLHNIKVSPLHPAATRTVWIGPWVLDEPCISKLTKEEK